MPGPEFTVSVGRPTAVIARPLDALAERLAVQVADAAAYDVHVRGVAHDSRLVRPGDLYAALPGTHVHGAAFTDHAAAAGAVAVLTDAAGAALIAAASTTQSRLPALVVEDPRKELGPVASWIYGEPSKRLRLAGVTGTNGKTTTCYLIESGLRAAGQRTGLLGTVETRVGSAVWPSVRTTPEAPELQGLLAAMVERGVGAAAMEVSSHALALHRVDGTQFAAVAFTNLSQDHLDFHADLDDYFAAKARLFRDGFAEVGVVNVDDPYGRRLTVDSALRTVSVSATGDAAADWRATEIASGHDGSRFTAVGAGVRVEVRVALAGAFNVANALVALATLIESGVAPDTAARGIGDLARVPGRMERVDAGQPFAALVDYAHTPDAVETLLTTVRSDTTGRVIVVLGCGGDRDRAKRPLMGAAAARLADVAVLTSDNPRSEDPLAILTAMRAGAESAAGHAEVRVEPDRATAIAVAVAAAAPGDVVVIAGKGHEQGQEVAGVIHPFDDRAVLRAQLRDRGWTA